MRRLLSIISLLLTLTATAQTATFTLQKNLKAGQLTPLCLPVTTTTSDFDELFAVGGIDANGRATLYPVERVEAGIPFVARNNTTRSSTVFNNTTVSTETPAELPLPWQGGSIQGTYTGYSWTYQTELGSVGNASALTYEIQDLLHMNFDVALENLNVRRFFAQNYYTLSSTCAVEKYNQAPTERRDVPNPVTLPIPPSTTGTVTVSIGTAEGLADVGVQTAEAEEAVCKVYNLIPQSNYYYIMEAGGTVVSQGQFHTKGHLRMIYAPSISNVRDLGGWPTQDGKRVRYGRIFRGGELNGQHVATEEDIQTMKRLGVTAEIDLRWAARPEEDFRGVSAFGFTEADGTFYYVDGNDWLGSEFDVEATQQHLKREFEMIVNTLRNGGSIYFHCVWGADRTGYLAFLLEAILGLTTDSYFKDYELTTFSIAGLRSKDNFADRPNYFNAYAGATLAERTANYLRTRLGISQEDIDFFRNTMLE